MLKMKRLINILKDILDELKEINSILADEQDENRNLHWLLLSQDNDIRKLKEKNKELKEICKNDKTKSKR